MVENRPLYFVPRNRTFTEHDPSEPDGVQMQSMSQSEELRHSVTVGSNATSIIGGMSGSDTSHPAAIDAAVGRSGGGGGGGWMHNLFRWGRNSGYDEIPSQPAGLLRHRAALPRKVPVKVEPKVFFANERTYLSWLHMSVILASISVAIVTMAEKESSAGMTAKYYGLALMPVAIAFAVYAMHMYLRRTAMLMRRDPGPYDDRIGPMVLGALLVLAIVTNFSVKIYETYTW